MNEIQPDSEDSKILRNIATLLRSLNRHLIKDDSLHSCGIKNLKRHMLADSFEECDVISKMS